MIQGCDALMIQNHKKVIKFSGRDLVKGSVKGLKCFGGCLNLSNYIPIIYSLNNCLVYNILHVRNIHLINCYHLTAKNTIQSLVSVSQSPIQRRQVNYFNQISSKKSSALYSVIALISLVDCVKPRHLLYDKTPSFTIVDCLKMPDLITFNLR